MAEDKSLKGTVIDLMEILKKQPSKAVKDSKQSTADLIKIIDELAAYSNKLQSFLETHSDQWSSEMENEFYRALVMILIGQSILNKVRDKL